MINYLKPRKHICFIILLSLLQTGCVKNDWIDLFDGKTMTGWKPSENKSSWQIVDGTLVTNGSRSHLFYVGDIGNHNFKNFEFVADVKTDSNSNSGIYFHTEFQESGWPDKGYECQVINSSFATHSDNYTERTMTGSLYAIRNLTKISG